MANAATIAAVGIRRGVPAAAVVVALATAWQESEAGEPRRRRPRLDRPVPAAPEPGLGHARADRRPAVRRRQVLHRAAEGQGLGEDAGHRRRAGGCSAAPTPRRTRSGPTKSEVLAAALAGEAGGAVGCTVDGEPAERGAAAAEALVQGPAAGLGRRRTGDGRADRRVGHRPRRRRPAGSTRTGWSRTPPTAASSGCASAASEWTRRRRAPGPRSARKRAPGTVGRRRSPFLTGRAPAGVAGCGASVGHPACCDGDY